MVNGIAELVRMSRAVGARVDYCQGASGNTSVKIDGTRMAVKSSGGRLREMTEQDGYSLVDWYRLKQFYADADGGGAERARSFEASCLLHPIGFPSDEPSVELGLHAILKPFVIHTHAVYANLLCCSEEGPALCEEIFGTAAFGALFVPESKPGYALTVAAGRALHARAAQGRPAQALFLQNHGLVVHADTAAVALELHQTVNDQIMKRFGIAIGQLTSDLEELAEDCYESHSPLVSEGIRSGAFSVEALTALPLFPEQVIYLNNLAGGDAVRILGGNLVVRAPLEVARAVDETALAWLFVTAKMRDLGLTPRPMDGEEVQYLKDWQAK